MDNLIVIAIPDSQHLTNVKNIVNKACYELYADESTATYNDAKTRCSDRGYTLPEILTPENYADFKAVADQTGSSKIPTGSYIQSINVNFYRSLD